MNPRLDSRWGGSFPLPGRGLHPLEAPGLAWRTEEVSRNLEERGAVGIVLIMNPRLEETPWDRLAATRSEFTRGFALTDPALTVATGMRVLALANAGTASVFFDGAPMTLADILQRDVKKLALPGFPLNGRLRGSTSVNRSPATSHNVVGILPGSDPMLEQRNTCSCPPTWTMSV